MFAIMFNFFFHDVKDAFKHSYHQVNRTVSLFAGISNGCSLFTFCYATFWMSAAPVCAQNYILRLTHRLWGVHLYVIEDADLKNIIFECEEERRIEFGNMEAKS